MEKVQVDILGIFANKAQDTTLTLVLVEVAGHRKLPIMIGIPEAQSIALAIEGKPLERPIMHDLFKEVLVKLGYTAKEVTITTLEDEIFLAQLILTNGTDTLQLDARPSDAIAIALRFEAPLFVNENLFNEVGNVLITQVPDQEAEMPKEPFYAQQFNKASDFQYHSLEALKKLLSLAIEQEDYEQAALIRDELKQREK